MSDEETMYTAAEMAEGDVRASGRFTPAPIWGVNLAGEVYYDGIPRKEWANMGLVLPTFGGGHYYRKVGLERLEYVRPVVIETTDHIVATQPVQLPVLALNTIDESEAGGENTLTRAGAYIIFGDAGSGKSALTRALATRTAGRIISIFEPDGPSHPGDAMGYSLAMRYVASKQTENVLIIDSLLTASVFGEALAAGGIAKSVFILAGMFDLAARRAKKIVLLVLNPLADMEGGKGYSIVEKSSMATTQGVIFTQGINPVGDALLVSATASFRPMRTKTNLPTMSIMQAEIEGASFANLLSSYRSINERFPDLIRTSDNQESAT